MILQIEDFRTLEKISREVKSITIIGGGFLGPFILGGITGGLLAPTFQRPIYGPMPIYPYPPYPIYQTQVYY